MFIVKWQFCTAICISNSEVSITFKSTWLLFLMFFRNLLKLNFSKFLHSILIMFFFIPKQNFLGKKFQIIRCTILSWKTMRLLRRSTNRSIFWLLQKSGNADEPARVSSIDKNGSLESTAGKVRPSISAFPTMSWQALQHWTDPWHTAKSSSSASTRTKLNFLASESFSCFWGLTKCLMESLPMMLIILLALGTNLQQVMPPIRNLQKCSLFHFVEIE